MEEINGILSGFCVPIALILCGIWFAVRLRFFYILHPLRFIKSLGEASESSGISSFRALTVALAGTLGVGNMAGVATAIMAGGAGALFWMWISAFCTMSIKYMEVKLAMETRRKINGEWHGGAMYYIEKAFGRRGRLWGGFFAVMCAFNALLTGNIVQVNSACAAINGKGSIIISIAVGLVGMWIAMGGGRRVSGATVALIPFLSAIYMILCLAIIFNNIGHLPIIFEKIINEAFSFRSAGAGVGGFVMVRAMRFGITRGIFSNEAGCGTSPTAHAQAEAKSSHHQACFGIFEVFADTIVLCTMTGIVILLCGESALDGIPLTLYAFESLAGPWASVIIAVSVVLFAFATVISQSGYGLISLEYLGAGKGARAVYLLLIPLASLIGAVISSNTMWQLADFTVSVMTLINVFCLVKLRGRADIKSSDT